MSTEKRVWAVPGPLWKFFKWGSLSGIVVITILLAGGTFFSAAWNWWFSRLVDEGIEIGGSSHLLLPTSKHFDPELASALREDNRDSMVAILLRHRERGYGDPGFYAMLERKLRHASDQFGDTNARQELALQIILEGTTRFPESLNLARTAYTTMPTNSQHFRDSGAELYQRIRRHPDLKADEVELVERDHARRMEMLARIDETWERHRFEERRALLVQHYLEVSRFISQRQREALDLRQSLPAADARRSALWAQWLDGRRRHQELREWLDDVRSAKVDTDLIQLEATWRVMEGRMRAELRGDTAAPRS